MSDERLLEALDGARDALVVAITDVRRGDHLRAADAIRQASEVITVVIAELREAA